MSVELIKGWCPTADRPMQSGDGWLTRLQPRPNGFSGAELSTLAALLYRHGAKGIEITQRGNWQFRGFATEDQALAFSAVASTSGLRDAELSKPKDGDMTAVTWPKPDAIASTMILAPGGLFDASTLIEPAEIARALERALSHQDLSDLPAKFAVLLASGGDFDSREVRADVLFIPESSSAARVALAGDMDTAHSVGSFPLAAAVRLTASLIATAPRGTRRDWSDTSLAGWKKRASDLVEDLPVSLTSERAAMEEDRPVARLWPAFGRLSLSALKRLGTDAWECRFQTGPERSLLVRLSSGMSAKELEAVAQSIGFITAAEDARRHVSVCVGKVGCANGSTDTLSDAVFLAEALRTALSETRKLHVSGCRKGCAHPGASAFVVTAEQGTYRFAQDATAFEAAAGRRLHALADLPALVQEMAAA